MKVDKFIEVVLDEIFNPVVVLLYVLAIAYFLWGVGIFIWNSGDDTAREKGKQHMIWGIVGIFVMASVQGIITLIRGTFGLP